MNLTEAETKEIEEGAKAHALQNEAARYFELKPTLRNIALQCSNESYIAGATAMAEKKNVEIEASNVSIKIWKNTAGEFKKCNDDLKAQLEAAQEELKNLKASHGQEIKQLKDERNLAIDSAISVQKANEAAQAELSRVKEVAKHLAEALKGSDRLNDNSKDVTKALTEFTNLMNKEK